MTSSMAISPEMKVSKSPRVVYRELSADEGGVLLHLDSGQYHRLNRMGSAIWELIDGKRTVVDLIEEVRKVAVDAPEGLMEDVRTFLEGLLSRELIEASS